MSSGETLRKMAIIFIRKLEPNDIPSSYLWNTSR